MVKFFTPYSFFPFFFLFFFSWSILPAWSQAPVPGAGNTLVLDGVNDYISAGLDNRGITNQVTVEAWIKTSSLAYQWIVGKYSNTQGEDAGYHLFVQNGKAALSGRDGSANYRSSGYSTTTVTDNRWHHLTGVCQGGRWEIWVDGILENSANTGYANVKLATIRVPLTIGNYYVFNENYFQGQIDEVRVWKTGRSQAEIRKFMCQKLTGAEVNLVAYFKADELENNTLMDVSTSRGNGLLQNFSGPALAVSGAPLGDESRDFYLSDWSGQPPLEIAGIDKHTFQVFSPAAATKGLHLYRVDAVPNTRSGVVGGSSPDYYYGVFTVSNGAAVTYTLSYKAYETSSCYSLYNRADNAQLAWSLLPTLNAPTASTLNKAGEIYRGEYLLNTDGGAKVELNGPASICSGSSAVLTATATGEGTYLWNTGATTTAITVDKPGTYSVRFTLAGGCYSEASYTITTGTVPPFSLGRDTVLCAGGTYVLKGPAGAGLTYKWQDGSTGASLNVSASGLYWLEVSQNNCVRRESVRITYDPRPVVNLGPDVILCEGQTMVLAAGNPGLKYRWQDGSTAATYAVRMAGTYWVDVENLSGCVTRGTVKVAYQTLPVFSLGRDTVLCAGSTYVLKGPAGAGLTYKWQDGSTGASLQVKAAGLYWLEVAQNGCVRRESVQVSYVALPQVNLGRDTTMCVGKALLLAAGNPGLKYRWQDGSTAATYRVQAAGTYWVDVENQSGCVSRGTIHVTYLTPPVVFLGQDTTLCAGQTLTLNKFLPGVNYRWQDGSTLAAYTITKPGKYWVRASLDVCAEADTILVRYQVLPQVLFSGDTVLCRGSSLVLSASAPGATYLWQDGSTAATFQVQQEGEYWVTIRQGNCTTTSSRRVLYQDCEPFIPNIITPNADASNETFYIRNINPREWALEIYNRWGARIYQTSRYGNDWAAKEVPDGVYFYKLSHPGLKRSYKGYLEVVR